MVHLSLYFSRHQIFLSPPEFQRDLQVILESSSNNNFVGSVIHPAGNIAEALLKEGMAKCVDWSISKVRRIA